MTPPILTNGRPTLIAFSDRSGASRYHYAIAVATMQPRVNVPRIARSLCEALELVGGLELEPGARRPCQTCNALAGAGARILEPAAFRDLELAGIETRRLERRRGLEDARRARAAARDASEALRYQGAESRAACEERAELERLELERKRQASPAYQEKRRRREERRGVSNTPHANTTPAKPAP